MQRGLLMRKQEIIQYLMLLGEELEELRIRRPVRLLMIGGAYMVTQFDSRAVTEDVDVLVYLDRYSDEYIQFREAIRYVAQDVHENLKWLSINIGDFMEEVGKVPRGRLWLEHGKLRVYVPDPQYVLALKMLAARDKDMDDLQFLFQYLQITKRRQAERILKKHVNQDILDDEEYAENIRRVLIGFFG
jgi:predicted nucleotidyltransferase